jgi:hypothetical protein
VGLFRKSSSELQSVISHDSSQFPKRIINRVLTLKSWDQSLCFAIEDRNGTFFLRWNLSDSSEWPERQLDSLESGTALLNEIAAQPKLAAEQGFIPGATNFYSYSTKKFGFAPVDFSVLPEKGYNADFTYGLGRDLAAKVESGWVPQGSAEQLLLLNFFALAPWRVGYFGPFKTLIKTLSANLDSYASQHSDETMQSIVSSLGFAYGRVEASLSLGHHRISEIDPLWSMDPLGSLVNGVRRAHPKKKTSEYLARSGLRLLASSQVLQDEKTRSRFIIGVMRGADFAHDGRVLSEDDYLQHQLMVSMLLYGEAGLASRDRDGRLAILGPRTDRHNLGITQSWAMNLSADVIEMYSIALKYFKGGHQTLTLFAFDLCEANPQLNFPWSAKTIETLLSNESRRARAAVATPLSENPALFRQFSPSLNISILESNDEELKKILLSDLEKRTFEYWPLAVAWAKKYVGKSLSGNTLEISILMLQNYWSAIPNLNWNWQSNPELPIRDTLFFQVIKKTKLHPFEKWINRTPLNIWGDDHLYAFFGIKPHPCYPEGLLDILDIREPELLNNFARMLGATMMFRNAERSQSLLTTFFQSSKRGSVELVWSIIQNGYIAPERIKAFLESMGTTDPSGGAFIQGMSQAIRSNSTPGLLKFLEMLGAESKDGFWRRNGKEVETLFMGWKGFPQFVWNNLDAIPARVLARFKKYEGLEAKILKLITPSSIARMSASQSEYFETILSSAAKLTLDPSILRAMIAAPSAEINAVAGEYVKQKDLYSTYWLLMLESNLPVSQQAAKKYLLSLIGGKDFVNKILMALDSNNVGARTFATQVLREVKSEAVLAKIVTALIENPNPEVWKIVSQNLELIDDVEKYREFTSLVFLTKRKARSVKEDLKAEIEDLIEDINDAMAEKTLVRMVYGSNRRDREWALRQIALSSHFVESAQVESAWNGDHNV